MEANKIKKSKKPVMVVLISVVISIIVLFIGVMGMAMRYSGIYNRPW